MEHMVTGCYRMVRAHGVRKRAGGDGRSGQSGLMFLPPFHLSVSCGLCRLCQGIGVDDGGCDGGS